MCYNESVTKKKEKKSIFGYVGSFLGKNSAHDLLPFFTSGGGSYKGDSVAKEINESYGCYEAAVEMLGEDLKKTRVIVVGDGVKPRTASLFAFWSGCKCYSIDPLMRTKWFHEDLPQKFGVKTRNLEVFDKKGEEIKIDCGGDDVLIVLPHSHCNMLNALKVAENCGKIHCINVPCCVNIAENFFDKRLLEQCDDFKLFSDPKMIGTAKKKVYVWKNMPKFWEK